MKEGGEAFCDLVTDSVWMRIYAMHGCVKCVYALAGGEKYQRDMIRWHDDDDGDVDGK